MGEDTGPDMFCVPYRRRGLYLALTVPFLLLLGVVFVYLLTVHFSLALIYLGFYLLMSFFQAYCCAYQQCPYVNGFCPAIVGILPAPLIARLLYHGDSLVKTRRRFELHATLASVAWCGLVLFPLPWLAKLGLIFAIGYAACHAVYSLVFVLTICPACATRRTCPGGKFSSLLVRERSQGQGKEPAGHCR